MQVLFRNVVVIGIAVAAPVVPFLLFGEAMEAWAREWAESEHGLAVTTFGIIALLAGDIFLPTPSSLITTLAGYQLGWFRGAIVSWVGMSLGAVIGFALARRFGRPLARWLSKDGDLEQMQALSDQTGPMLLVLTRAVPVLAEASVLLMGMHQLSWQRFLPPVLFANLVISFAYALFGEIAKQQSWFPLAVIVSIVIPVVTSIVFKRFISDKKTVAADAIASDTTHSERTE